jgi:drug/metabolite transporter (DMT)-like permease
MNKRIKYMLIAAALSLAFLAVLGIPTALIPSPFFKRMIAPTTVDYALLALTAALAGSYVSYSLYLKSVHENKSDYAAVGGTLTAVFGFGCPICNALLVVLFGSTALLVFFEPYRHYLSLLTIALFATAFYLKAKKCRECK